MYTIRSEVHYMKAVWCMKDCMSYEGVKYEISIEEKGALMFYKEV